MISEIVPPPAMLLDFGCGLGDFMRQAIKMGYTAEGFEVSNFAADFARAEGLKVYADLDELPADYYDIVTAVEVFEHCSSPMKVLRAIYKCLKPGGCLYYTTLNFDGFYQSWRKGVNDPRDGYILPEGHIHFFSTKVMQAYFKQIGFSESFTFESSFYKKDSRLFQLLAKLRLINGRAESPDTALASLLYYGGRRLLSTDDSSKRPLPLARK